MARYIHQVKDWPNFTWQEESLLQLLAEVRHRQGKLVGTLQGIGFHLRAEASLQILTLDVVKSSEIEGDILNTDQVRSSIARRLGMDIAGLVPSNRHTEGVVEMMLDATQHYAHNLTEERMFGWHANLFPTGMSDMRKIVVGAWRDNTKDDPMQVVSGPMGREKVHYQAPDSELVPDDMNAFLKWFNHDSTMDPVLKAAVAHLWFVTIHPFDDGNGRIARAIADRQLARSDESPQRFYSMSAQIRKERNAYYDILEFTQQRTLDITAWMEWFLGCLHRALISTDEILANIFAKAKFWERNADAALNERQKFMLNKMLDGLDGKLNNSKWAKMTKSSSDTALRDITDLISKAILVKEEGGGRSTSYDLKKE